MRPHPALESLRGQVIAFDGKALRGAMRRSAFPAALHKVHLWAHEQQVVLAQRVVDGAADEPAALIALLEVLNVEGATLTGDAQQVTHGGAVLRRAAILRVRVRRERPLGGAESDVFETIAEHLRVDRARFLTATARAERAAQQHDGSSSATVTVSAPLRAGEGGVWPWWPARSEKPLPSEAFQAFRST